MFIIYMLSFIVSMIYIFFVKAEYKNYKCLFILKLSGFYGLWKLMYRKW